MSTLFLSYRRTDSPDPVTIIYDRLAVRFRHWSLFYDHRSILPGEPFPEALRRALTTADVVIVIIGPRWLETLRERAARPDVDHVREEVRLALAAGRPMLPVVVGDARVPTHADLADFPDIRPLADLNALRIRPDPDLESDVARLLAAVERLGPGEGPGSTLGGRYKLVREVGAGGMGVVFLAEQVHPRREVAVKLVKPGMDSRGVLVRVDAERRALGLMAHPNIARALDAGTTPVGRPYFVMEYVRGVAITRYCDEQRLPLADRLALFRQVCDAVQHAHQKGVIHRDVKPSNVLVEVVDGRPVPKVIDFGLAKALGGRLTDRTLFTDFRAFVGTLEYASPEQAAGAADVDTRTDVYSLGALLYELLSGSPPFPGPELAKAGEAEALRIVRESDPPRLSSRLGSTAGVAAVAASRATDPGRLAREVRGELEWIVAKSLEKERDRRYQTAAAFADDIARFLSHEPVSAARPSAAYRARKFLRRNRGPVAAAGLVAATLVLGIVGTTLGLLRADAARVRAETAEGDARRGWAEEARQRAEANRRRDELAETDRRRRDALRGTARFALHKGLGLCEEGHGGEGLLWLARALEAVPDDAPELEHVIRTNLAGWAARQEWLHALEPHGLATAAALDASRDRRYFATGGSVLGGGGEARLWDAATCRPLGPPLAHKYPVHAVAFSPDSRLLLTGSGASGMGGVGGEARLWEPGTGRVVCDPLEHEQAVLVARFSPAGDRLLTAGGRRWASGGRGQLLFFESGEARLWDTATRQPVGDRMEHKWLVEVAAFAADGKTLLTGSGRFVSYWDAATQKQVPDSGGALMRGIRRIAFGPTGDRMIAYLGTEVLILDPKTDRRLARLMTTEEISSAGFAGDDDSVLLGFSPPSGMGVGEAYLWDFESETRRSTRLGHRGAVLALALGPDRATLLALDASALRVWRLAPDPHPLLETDEAISFAGLGPDGDSLTLVTSDRVRSWAGVGGPAPRLVQEGAPGLGDLVEAAMSPDGRTLLLFGDNSLMRGYGSVQPGRWKAQFWDIAGGRALGSPVDLDGPVGAATFSPDGRTVVTCYVNYLTKDKAPEVRFWDAGRYQLRGEPIALDEEVEAIAFRPDGKQILLAGSHTVTLWGAAGEAALPGPIRRHPGRIEAAGYTPDGPVVLAVADGQVGLLTADTGRPVGRPVRLPSYQRALLFPDGQRFLTDHGVYHAGTACLYCPFPGGQIATRPVAVSADGRTVVIEAKKRRGLTNSVLLWHLPPPVEGSAGRSSLWVQAMTGLELTEEGIVQALDPEDWRQRKVRLQDAGGPPGGVWVR